MCHTATLLSGALVHTRPDSAMGYGQHRQQARYAFLTYIACRARITCAQENSAAGCWRRSVGHGSSRGLRRSTRTRSLADARQARGRERRATPRRVGPESPATGDALGTRLTHRPLACRRPIQTQVPVDGTPADADTARDVRPFRVQVPHRLVDRDIAFVLAQARLLGSLLPPLRTRTRVLAPIRLLNGRRESGRWGQRRSRAGRRLFELRALMQEERLQRLTQVADHMEAVSDLDRLRGAACRRVGVGAGAVATHDGNARLRA
jgi:hypothetical protein